MQCKPIINIQNPRAAFYARVSSDKQAAAGTIASQVQKLEERVAADGVSVTPSMRFIDEGHSGSTLLRPSLEKLRDMASADQIDRLYVLCPDRLSRKHSHQMLLMEELERLGVEVVFLDHESRNTPEDRLLVQVQGVVAEYEREKIMERSRRGKLHAAREGRVGVLSSAPYGYRYVPAASGMSAQYMVQLPAAAVVRDVFQWIGMERLSLYAVCKRLENKGILSPKGCRRWDRSTIWGMLKNPAYMGKAAFGKTAVGPMRARLRGGRGRAAVAPDGKGAYDTPRENWISIAVPAIISPELFDTVAEQLEENKKRCRRGKARHLLQGLVVCKRCGYAFYGHTSSANKSHVYYRCSGTESARFGGHAVCDNKPVCRDALDQAVWQDVRSLLADPTRIETELHRRLDQDGPGGKDLSKKLQSQIDKVKRGIARLTDAYRDGFLEKEDFELRIKSGRSQLSQLQTELQSQADQEGKAREMRGIVDNLRIFSRQVMNGLDSADWETKQKLIRTLVRQIEIDKETVNVVYRVDLPPFDQSPNRGRSHYCRRSHRLTRLG
jgi:site-specific DNA recombinase